MASLTEVECDKYCASDEVNCDAEYSGHPHQIHACKIACLDCRYPLKPCNCVSNPIFSNKTLNKVHAQVSKTITETLRHGRTSRPSPDKDLTDETVVLIAVAVFFILLFCLFCCFWVLKKRRGDDNLLYDNITSARVQRGAELSPFVGYDYPKQEFAYRPNISEGQKRLRKGMTSGKNPELSTATDGEGNFGADLVAEQNVNMGKNAYFEICLS